MLALQQKLVIMLILLLAFAGRIAVASFPALKKPQEISKTISNEKSESSEKENQLEEKVKLADALIPSHISSHFRNSYQLKSNLFADSFNLTYCHLSIPGQPPKILVS